MNSLLTRLLDFLRSLKDYDKLNGFIRHLLTTVGGALLALGIIDEETWQTITGFVFEITGIIWSFLDKMKNEPSPEVESEV